MSLFFKKARVWLKNYWYVPALLIYTLVMWLVFRKKNQNLVKMFEISKESYQKEITAINKAHEEEMKQREKIVLVYQETLKNIEAEYKIKTEDLSKKKKEEIKDIVEKFNDDPSGLAEEMKKLFGV